MGDSDRVGTFLWNNQTHLEAYLAIPGMGAVLHTLNLRLFPEQLSYVINHAEDKVIIVDASLIPLLARVRDQLTTVKHIVVAGEGDTGPLGPTLSYEELLGAEEPGYEWPTFDERQAAAMCYTSGTTGNPKGVVYSHRSTYLHSMAITSGVLARHQRARPGPLHRPHVPRQRLGDPLRLLHDRGRPGHAPAVPPGRAVDRHHRPAPADALGRGAHHLERPAPPRAEPSRRPVVAADDHRRGSRRCPGSSSSGSGTSSGSSWSRAGA